MNPRPIQLLLAMLMAFWSPVWCCCAAFTHTNASTPSDIAPATCAHCVTTGESSSDSTHHPASSSEHGHDCPHASLRTIAQIEKAPSLEPVTSPAPFTIPVIQISPIIAGKTATAHICLLAHQSNTSSSLVTLRCQLTV